MYLRQIKRPQGLYLAIQESYYDDSIQTIKELADTVETVIDDNSK